jgi:hypothetical protein
LIKNVVSSDAGVWKSRLVVRPTRIAPSFWGEIRGKAMLTEKPEVDSFTQFVVANEARLRHALIATRSGGVSREMAHQRNFEIASFADRLHGFLA